MLRQIVWCHHKVEGSSYHYSIDFSKDRINFLRKTFKLKKEKKSSMIVATIDELQSVEVYV